ncbi:MAG: large conductance mechanosensitive channel protein MscL [Clostridia bacterium]|nr:large conductance mechanosensitive channel protein MscL [Clostridia bacterium]
MKKNKEKKKSSFWADFKAFITKGNILDLAVAVVIGGAFNAIITSLVNNIIMPLVGLLTGKASLADLDAWVKAPTYVLDENGEILIENGKKVIVEGTGAGHIQYGLFLQAIVNFLIIALTIFVVVRLIRKSQERFAFREKAKAEEAKKKAEEEAAIAAEAKAKADAEAAAIAAEKEAQLKAFYEANAKQTELLEKILEKINK